MRDVIESHESIPWRRRNFERKGVLDQLLITAGFSPQWKESADEGEGGEAAQNPAALGTGFAQVPQEVPEGPTLELVRQDLFGWCQAVLAAYSPRSCSMPRPRGLVPPGFQIG